MAVLGSEGDNNSLAWGCPLHPVPFTYPVHLSGSRSGPEHLRWACGHPLPIRGADLMRGSFGCATLGPLVRTQAIFVDFAASASPGLQDTRKRLPGGRVPG